MSAPSQPPVDEAILRHVIEEDAVVRAYVYAVLRGHRDTQDVIQEVWMAACRKIGEYDSRRPFRGWVLGITRLQLLKWRQSQARSHEVLSPDVVELLAETAEAEQEDLALRSEFLADCLGRLPASGRHVLDLRYSQGLKIAAVAEELRKSVAAVEMALVRLRRSLRDCIERKLAEGIEGGL